MGFDPLGPIEDGLNSIGGIAQGQLDFFQNMQRAAGKLAENLASPFGIITIAVVGVVVLTVMKD